MVDQLTDMLVRLKNGQKRGLNTVMLKRPASKLCLQLLEILQREGYIYSYTIKQNKPLSIEVKLKYTLLGTPVITKINRISKPSKRVYVNSKSLWSLNSGMGIFIISTPKGLMTDLDAKIINQGGEILCSII
jgi:small subunit ribosomal protein S8